jgi:hypothetical protein
MVPKRKVDEDEQLVTQSMPAFQRHWTEPSRLLSVLRSPSHRGPTRRTRTGDMPHAIQDGEASSISCRTLATSEAGTLLSTTPHSLHSIRESSPAMMPFKHPHQSLAPKELCGIVVTYSIPTLQSSMKNREKLKSRLSTRARRCFAGRPPRGWGLRKGFE